MRDDAVLRRALPLGRGLGRYFDRTKNNTTKATSRISSMEVLAGICGACTGHERVYPDRHEEKASYFS